MDGLRLLLWKNLKVQLRSRLSTVELILAPSLAVLALGLFHTVFPVQHEHNPVIYESFPVKKLPKVIEKDTSALYYYPANPLTDSIMKIVHTDFFKDQGLNFTLQGYASLHELTRAYDKVILESKSDASRGHVLGAVVFENLPTKGLPTHIQYTIKLPATQRTFHSVISDRGGLEAAWQTGLNFAGMKTSGPRCKNSLEGGFPGYFAEGFLYLQFALDTAITRQILANSSDFAVNTMDMVDVQLQRFPFPAHREDKFEFVISWWSPIILTAMFAFPVMDLTSKLIQERSTQLKEFLMIMGLRSQLHWLAWFLSSFAVLLVTMGFFVAAAKVSVKENLSFLQYSDTLVVFTVLAAFCWVIIGYSFFLSVLISSPETGALAAGFFWILLCYPINRFRVTYEDYSNVERYFALFLGGPATLNLVICFLASSESRGEGLQWDNLWNGITTKDELSVGALTLAMIVTGALYMVLAIYIELVLPGPFGTKHPWYFPFMRSYWVSSAPSSLDNYANGEVAHTAEGAVGRNGSFEESPKGAVGIELIGLTKNFASQAAVSNLHIRMYKNQVTAWLGHNGAGKTTTMSMITGFLRPSAGTAIVGGYDVRRDVQKIRRSLGFCPQNNILFDDLTVVEHLQFYCALKGFNKADSKAEVDRWLRVLGLEAQKGTLGKNLSAGNKRKLCVGIAFAAGSKVVLLDEPTAGIDPIGRRSIWDIIQTEKYGRTVILSTHYMEEADLLGDRIAIMASGKLECCGSSAFLKRKYGPGYNLEIAKQEAVESTAALKNRILQFMPNAEFTCEAGRLIKCVVPTAAVKSLQPLFDDLDQRKTDLGIVSYKVFPSTMEQVFISFNKESKSPARAVAQNDLTVAEVTEFTAQQERCYQKDRSVGCYLWLQQFKALAYKRWLITLRQPLPLLLQVIMPPLTIVASYWNEADYPGFRSPPARSMTLKDYSKFGNPTILLSCDDSRKAICDAMQRVYNSSATFVHVPSSTSLASYILEKTEQSLWRVESDYLFALEARRNASNPVIQLVVHFNNQMLHLLPLGVNLLTNTLIEYLGRSPYMISVTNHPFDYSAEGDAFALPGLSPTFFVGFNMITGVGVLFATFLIGPTLERLTDFKQCQKIMGVELWTYWLVEFVVTATIAVVTVVLMIIFTNIMVDTSLDKWEVQLPCFLLVVSFAAATIPITSVLSLLCNNAGIGMNRLCIYTAVSSLLGIYAYTVLINPEFELEDKAASFNEIMLLFPPYSLGSGVWRVVLNHDLKVACNAVNMTALCQSLPFSPCCTEYRKNYFAWDGLGIAKNLTWQLSLGLFFLTLLILLESQALYRLLACPPRILMFSSQYSGDAAARQDNLQLEVYDYPKHVQNGCRASPVAPVQHPLVLQNLSKAYGGKSVVNGLSMASFSGEILGFLGVNGSGKTTALKMVAQATNISSGDAYICSKSVKRETRAAHNHLGYCPQWDPFSPELTGKEMLSILALMRGCKPQVVPHLVMSLASRLLLRKHLNVRIGNYSGGNRRKLAIAVAMLGEPQVILLDEPTAGIDPVAKLYFWKAIESVRDSTGASILIASQDMEEVEFLCSRIAVVTDGQLQCIGSPEALQSELCAGYKLVVRFTTVCSSPNTEDNHIQSSSWNTLKTNFGQFISENLPGCVLNEDHVGYLEYLIPLEGITFSRIISALHDNAFASNIEGYCIGRAGIVQVLFKYGRRCRRP